MTAKTPILILGTYLLAEELLDLFADIEGVEVAGFVENLDQNRCAQQIEGLPVHWIGDPGLAALTATHRAVSGISTTRRGPFIRQVAALGFSFATLVHPTASIARSVRFGPGCIVSRGVLVGARTRIGEHVFINRGAMIGHHTEIGDFVSIQPGANIAGACRIGPTAFIAMDATVIDRITVGAGAMVAAGAVVTGDVPDRALVAGVPARVVKTDIVAR